MREKLIEVFTHLDRHIQNRDEYGICYSSDFAEIVEWVHNMAKNEDANGVTFETDNNVGHKWIPVTERLPDDDVQVLACTKHGKAFPAHCEGRKWSVSHSVTITHWMPMPEAPKGE